MERIGERKKAEDGGGRWEDHSQKREEMREKHSQTRGKGGRKRGEGQTETDYNTLRHPLLSLSHDALMI